MGRLGGAFAQRQCPRLRIPKKMDRHFIVITVWFRELWMFYHSERATFLDSSNGVQYLVLEITNRFTLSPRMVGYSSFLFEIPYIAEDYSSHDKRTIQRLQIHLLILAVENKNCVTIGAVTLRKNNSYISPCGCHTYFLRTKKMQAYMQLQYIHI